MVNLVKTRPLRRMTQAELDRWLEDAADILRGNVDHSEYHDSSDRITEIAWEALFGRRGK